MVFTWEAFLTLLLLLLAAFDEDRCYEPFLAHGNFSTSDPLYRMGTVVEFACSAGYMLEQGPSAIECIDSRDPRWNESEPTCKGNLSAYSAMPFDANSFHFVLEFLDNSAL